MNTITRTATLTGSERRSLTRLQDACRIHDRAELSYPLDESDATHFLNHLSDGTLISALAIIPCGDSIAECIAFTLPEYRRNGFFSDLLRRASDEFKEWDILFPVPGSPACLDTLAVLNALGAELVSREFQMEWQAGISPLASFTGEGFALISPSPSRFELRRGDALCGFLDTDAALGADLLLGFTPQASYVLSDGNGGTVTVQLHAAKASLSPVRDGGEAAVRITVRVRAGVTESSGADTADREMLALLEDELSRAVTAQIEAAAEASRTLDADFLELWRILPEVKNDGVLAALRADVQTESTLERSYDIYGSAHGKEKPHG